MAKICQRHRSYFRSGPNSAGVFSMVIGVVVYEQCVGVEMSSQNPRSLWVVGSTQEGARWISATRNIDFITTRFDEIIPNRFRMIDVTHGHCAAESVPVRTGGRVADGLAIAIDGFAAPEDGLRIFQHENHQAPLHAGLFLFL